MLTDFNSVRIKQNTKNKTEIEQTCKNERTNVYIYIEKIT